MQVSRSERSGQHVALLYAAFVSFSLLLGALALIGYNHIAASLKTRESGRVQAVADLKSWQIEQWMRERMDDTRALATNPLVRTLLSNRPDPAIENDERLKSLVETLRISNKFHSIEFYGPRGDFLFTRGSSPHKRENLPASLQTGLRGLATPLLIDFHREVPNPALGPTLPIDLEIAIAVRSGGAAGTQVAGFIVLVIDPENFLFPLAQSWPGLSETGESFLVRREGGDVLFLSRLWHSDHPPLSLRLPLGNTQDPAVLAVTRGDGIYEGIDYRKTAVLAATRNIAGTPWHVVAKVDRAEALQELKLLAISAGVIYLIIVVASGSIVVLYLRQRKLAENLSTQESNFRLMAENIEEVFFVAHADYKTFIYIGPAFSRIWGRQPERLIANPQLWFEWIHPEDREKIREFLKEHIGSGSYAGRFRIVRPDGAVRWIASQAFEFASAPGKALQVVGVQQDITEQMQAELSMLEAQHMAALGSFTIELTSGTFTHSPEFERILGLTPDFARTVANWLTLLHKDDRERIWAHFQNDVLRDRQEFNSTYRVHRHNDGAERWIHGLGRLQVDAAGQPLTLIGSIQDITERHLQEERIRLAAQVFSTASEAIFVSDLEGRLIEVNETACRLAKYTREEMLKLRNIDIVAPSDRERIAPELAKVDSGHIIENRWLLLCADGSTVPLDLAVQRLPDDRYLAIGRDLTEREKIIEALHAARVAAETANRAKSQFLANISHEIRTPMTAIMGITDLCLTAANTPRQRRNLAKIKQAGGNLLTIIGDLLDYAKIEAGKLNLDIADFALDDILDNLVVLLGERASAKDIELLFDIDPSVPALLRGDSLRIGQILINLLSNAIKFSEHGDVVLTVRVAARHESRVTLDFSIADEGIGMTIEEQQRLFQPFAQADASTTRKYGGTGLGLVISQSLVALMGGSIALQSTPGEGATFSFAIELDALADADATHATALAPFAGAAVLLIDDNPRARAIDCAILAQLGLTPQACSDLTAASDLLAASPKPFLAVLLDERLERSSSSEVRQALREQIRRRAVPLILLSDFSFDPIVSEEDNAGMLVKPLTLPHLALELCQLLGVAPAPTDAEEPTADSTQSIAGADVLLVEDVALSAEVISEMLIGMGLFVRLAKDGEQALASIAKRCPDIVLMDCHMPVMDGFEATRRLRQDPRYAALPIIALTANAAEEDRRICLEAGMNDFVAKPVDIRLLHEILARYLKLAAATLNAAPVDTANAPATLPDLPGLDVAAGLAGLGNRDFTIYTTLLKKFEQGDCTHFPEKLAQALAAADWSAAVRLAHSLKGVANMLGALELGKHAHDLQNAIKAQDTARIPAAQSATLAELERVRLSIASM